MCILLACGFHHKQCASDLKDFTFVKIITQMFSSADESLKGCNASTALSWFASNTVHFCVYGYNVCGEASAHVYGEEQSSTTQMFSSADESLKDETRPATALSWFASDTAHFCVHLYMYAYA